ncbi:MAG: molybdopterin-dependent oxidoreductase [Desulfobacterales bacterium]
MGQKGAGRFEETSWDHALSVIAEKFLGAREKWGAESVVLGSGTTRGMAPYLNRFLSVFGSPTFMAPSNMSGGPTIVGSAATAGFALVDPDYEKTACMVLWAHNPEASWPGLYMHHIRTGLKNGAKLIVVDPRGTNLAKKADHWLQIRPGTDVALALCMINYIIENNLYDKAFVENWTVGFDRFKDHVADFTVEKCSEITWIPEKQIEAAARTFATAESACIGPGMAGVCQANDAFDLSRALTGLSAITGNLGSSRRQPVCSPTRRRNVVMVRITVHTIICPRNRQKETGAGYLPAAGVYPHSVSPQAVWPAILDEKPYPVKALGLFANNSVCAYPNSKRVVQVLEKLDFLLSVDYFHTPTTAFADVILPPAHWTERDDVEDLLMQNYVFCQRKAIDPVPECRDEKQILVDLADKMGLEGFWSSVQETWTIAWHP